jgi:hypothetical protein
LNALDRCSVVFTLNQLEKGDIVGKDFLGILCREEEEEN